MSPTVNATSPATVWGAYKTNRQAALDTQYANDLAAWKTQCANYDAYYAAWPPEKRVGIDPPPMPPTHSIVTVDLLNLTSGQPTVTETPQAEQQPHVLPAYVAPVVPTAAPVTSFPGINPTADSDALSRIEAKLDKLLAAFNVK